MKKVAPVNSERKFEIDELFFSTTDQKGIIQYGNDVFVKISGYAKDDLIGAPHNIIRHPDMPKIVFKLLWDTIKNNKMIAAYVKNMASDGTYYWVLAVVFPVKGQYLSVRLKPTTAYRAAAEEIYKKVLVGEKENGVEASGVLLFKLLNEAGFKTYEQFFAKALVSEISARDQFLLKKEKNSNHFQFKNSSDKNLESTLQQISNQAFEVTHSNREMFLHLDEFENSTKKFKDNTNSLLDSFLQFQLMSLNMRVYAAQIGQEGASLAVVAQNFQDLVSSIQKYLEKFSADSEVLSGHIQNFTIIISCLKLLIDIVDFFIQESLSQISRDVTNQTVLKNDAFHDLKTHSELFTFLSDQFIHEFNKIKNLAQDSVSQFDLANREIRKFVNGIELVSQIGSVESTRLTDGGKNFKHDIENMIKFSESLRSSATIISSAAKDLSVNLNKYDIGILLIEKSMKNIFKIALNLDQSDQNQQYA